MAGERITRTGQFADVQRVFTLLPEEMIDTLVTELKDIGAFALARARAGVPVSKTPRRATFRRNGARRPTGGLRSLLGAELNAKELRVTVGLLTPADQSLGFYGYILDAGRGLKSRRSRPRRSLIATRGKDTRFGRQKLTRRFSRTISVITPGRYDITFGRARTAVREYAGEKLSEAYDLALSQSGWSLIGQAVLIDLGLQRN